MWRSLSSHPAFAQDLHNIGQYEDSREVFPSLERSYHDIFLQYGWPDALRGQTNHPFQGELLFCIQIFSQPNKAKSTLSKHFLLLDFSPIDVESLRSLWVVLLLFISLLVMWLWRRMASLQVSWTCFQTMRTLKTLCQLFKSYIKIPLFINSFANAVLQNKKAFDEFSPVLVNYEFFENLCDFIISLIKD